MNGAGLAAPSCGKANIQTWPNLAFSPSCPLPWLDLGVVVWSCMHVHMSLSVSLYTSQVCRRIKQLQIWAPGRKATFADLPLIGHPVLFQNVFSHSRLEKNEQSMTQRLMMMVVVVTDCAASQAD